MNGAESKGGPRVPKPLESDAPRPRSAKPAEKFVVVDFSGSDAVLLKQLSAVQANAPPRGTPPLPARFHIDGFVA